MSSAKRIGQYELRRHLLYRKIGGLSSFSCAWNGLLTTQ